MYSQLLYSTGGGIISNDQKGEQENCVTLAIGLGGTGIDCLRNLKRMVYEQVLPDDPESSVPSYSYIKFLAVDTDRSSLKEDGKINPLSEETEFFDLSIEGFGELLKDSRMIAGMPECQWLKLFNPKTGEPGIKIYSDRPEAGGQRQIGRLLIIEKSDAFVDKVRQLVTEARQGFPRGVNVNVHIFTGLGGGTGSGIFLDVCYLVQKALEDIGEGGYTMTYGYFFLPDVNLSLPHISARTEISQNIQANGYAAMKELDYCMGFGLNGGCWEQQYRGFKCGPVYKAPVENCYLISAKSFNGNAPVNGYEYAMNVTGEYILLFLVKSDTPMLSHVVSCNDVIRFISKTHGANNSYFALGASKATVPIREISTYLGSKLFEAFRALMSKYPTNEEIEQFAKENSLDFHGLLGLVMDKTSFNLPVIEFPERMLRNRLSESDLGLPNELILPNEIMLSFCNMRDRMVVIVENNISALMHDWRRDRIGENYDSISRVWKVFFALEQMVSDPDKGPFYALAVLYGSDRKNLVDILQSDYEEIIKRSRNYSYDLKLRMDAVKKARSAYLHPGLLQSRRKLFNAFLEETANYYELTGRILVLEKMLAMIRTMIEQFKDLYKKHFEPFHRIYDELLETFHENYQVISASAYLRASDDPLKILIPKPDDQMMELLDSAVEKLDIEQELHKFNSSFFMANDVWVTEDKSKIAKYVSDYVINVFDEYTRKMMTKYLEMQFDTIDPLELRDKTCSEVLRVLSEMAAPLFWRNSLIIQNSRNLGCISVPESSVIQSAASALDHQVYEFSIIRSKSVNRILVLRSKCGLSMCDYNGIRLYKEAYLLHDSAAVGRHIYEGTESDPRDWRKLPDPIPFSMIKKPTKEMLENEKKYNRAVEYGIIHEDQRYHHVYHLDEYEGIDDIECLAEKAAEECDRTIAKEVLSKIKDYLQNRKLIRVWYIPNYCTSKYEETVRIDFVMGSNVYLKVIERQLGILDALDRIKERMDEINLRD